MPTGHWQRKHNWHFYDGIALIDPTRKEGQDYEPAFVLLERINAEREKVGEGSRKGRRKK